MRAGCACQCFFTTSRVSPSFSLLSVVEQLRADREAVLARSSQPVSLPPVEGTEPRPHTSIMNSAPSAMLRAVSLPPMFFSMMALDMNSPTPVPDCGPLVVK